MKIFRVLVVMMAAAGLSSCGATSTSETSTTVTTIAAPDCSKAAIEIGVGEPISTFNCSGDWAGIQPSSYVSSCTECESVWLYKWESGAWNLKGLGNQYLMLTPEVGNMGMTGLLKDKIYTGNMTEYPSQEVACELWPTNRYPENVAETGCTPDPEM